MADISNGAVSTFVAVFPIPSQMSDQCHSQSDHSAGSTRHQASARHSARGSSLSPAATAWLQRGYSVSPAEGDLRCPPGRLVRPILSDSGAARTPTPHPGLTAPPPSCRRSLFSPCTIETLFVGDRRLPVSLTNASPVPAPERRLTRGPATNKRPMDCRLSAPAEQCG